MGRGPLYEDNYTPQLSGHETFPLRYGWLKKAFDAVRNTEDCEDNRSVFLADDAHRPIRGWQEYGRVNSALGHRRGCY